MAEKRLYRIEVLAYAYAETEDDAIQVYRERGVLWDDTVEADEATDVDAEWEGALPYGGDDNRTCAQLLQAQREAQEAQWEAQEAATPDPNQLALKELEETA